MRWLITYWPLTTAPWYNIHTRTANGTSRNSIVAREGPCQGFKGSLLTKLPVGYDLWKHTFQFCVYLLCLNDHLAQCLNKFLFVKSLVGTFNMEKAQESRKYFAKSRWQLYTNWPRQRDIISALTLLPRMQIVPASQPGTTLFVKNHFVHTNIYINIYILHRGSKCGRQQRCNDHHYVIDWWTIERCSALLIYVAWYNDIWWKCLHS